MAALTQYGRLARRKTTGLAISDYAAGNRPEAKSRRTSAMD